MLKPLIAIVVWLVYTFAYIWALGLVKSATGYDWFVEMNKHRRGWKDGFYFLPMLTIYAAGLFYLILLFA